MLTSVIGYLAGLAQIYSSGCLAQGFAWAGFSVVTERFVIASWLVPVVRTKTFFSNPDGFFSTFSCYRLKIISGGRISDEQSKKEGELTRN